MHLLSATFRYLHEGLLSQLAQASELPAAEAEPFAETAVAALGQQLSQSTDLGEQNARWDMCRQLFLSQLLVNHGELLRTDLGWPERRRYLAEKLLGSAQITQLVNTTSVPAAATRLLGYLTILVLAVAGEHASSASLDPAAMSRWLRQQAGAAPAPAKEAAPARPTPPAPARPSAPAAAPAAAAPAAGKRPVLLAAGVAGLLALGLAGYFATGKATEPTEPATTPAAVAPSPAPAPVAPVVEPVSAVAAPTPAPAPVAAPAALPKAAVAAGPVLRDTIGNASAARAIGGQFNVAAGRYPKGEGQPLIIKLAGRTTLAVGINSTESLLYKRLVNPALPRPSDIVLDRLNFDNSRASLGAEGAQQLGSVANLLKTFPRVHVLVLGHANLSETDANKLGLKRAAAAVEELQKQGVAASRLQAQGVMATGTPTDDDSAERQALLQGISLKISRL